MHGVLILGLLSGQGKEAQNANRHFGENGIGEKLKNPLDNAYNEIGALLGGVSYSAVAKTYRRTLERLQTDLKLRKKIEQINASMSNVKADPSACYSGKL